jgi:hypothetical protein
MVAHASPFLVVTVLDWPAPAANVNWSVVGIGVVMRLWYASNT